MKIFGFPLKVDISFFILAAILGWRGDSAASVVIWVAIVFGSVLFHELGHAFAGRAFGLSPRIQLYGMGGLTSWSEGAERLSPVKMIVVSLAGPIAGAVLGGLVLVAGLWLGLHKDRGLLGVAFGDLLWVNFGFGILNMIPMLPLDGGKVMSSLEELVRGKSDATVSRIISLLIAVIGGLLSLKVGWLWTLILSCFFALANGTALLKQFQQHSDRKLGGLLEEARNAVQKGDGALAVTLARQALESAKSDSAKTQALQLLVHAHIRRRNFNQAAEALNQLQSIAGADPYLQGFLLLEMGDITRALTVLEQAFERRPSKWTGYLLGQAYIKAKRFDDAMALCSNPALADFTGPLCVALEGEAFQAGRYETAMRAGVLAFERERDPLVAYNVACALARSARSEEAIEWINRAVDAGFKDHAKIKADPDLDTLRGRPEFQSIYGKLAESPA